MKYLKYIMPLVFAALLIGVCTTVIYRGTTLANDLIDQELPNTELYSYKKQQSITLHKIKDKTYLLNIFATWCNYCNREKPLLTQLQQKYNLPLYGVLYMDDLANVPSDIKHIFKDILVENSGQFLSSIGCDGLPETLIIHKNRIVYRLRGPVDQQFLSKDLNELLKQLQ